MSNHWQFCTNALTELNNQLTWNAAPVCNEWAVFIGVIIWFKFYELEEGNLVDRFCKQWDLIADRKERVMGFCFRAGRGRPVGETDVFRKMKCNISYTYSMVRFGVECSVSTVSFPWGTLLLELRDVRHGDLANPYSHFSAVSRPLYTLEIQYLLFRLV